MTGSRRRDGADDAVMPALPPTRARGRIVEPAVPAPALAPPPRGLGDEPGDQELIGGAPGARRCGRASRASARLAWSRAASVR